MIRVFAPYQRIVTPSGSCAAMVREHFPTLFEEGSAEHHGAVALGRRTYEFAEFLTDVEEVNLRDLGVKWQGSATYHYSCHYS